MQACVVDTDVVSFYIKRDSRTALYTPHLEGRVQIVSFMTVAELDLWPLKRSWGPEKRADLEQYIAKLVIDGWSRDLSRQWASVTDTAQRNGRRIEVADAWIAATALNHDIPLVTHNPDDYAGLPKLTIISA